MYNAWKILNESNYNSFPQINCHQVAIRGNEWDYVNKIVNFYWESQKNLNILRNETNIYVFSTKLKYKVISIKIIFDTDEKKKKILPSTTKL